MVDLRRAKSPAARAPACGANADVRYGIRHRNTLLLLAPAAYAGQPAGTGLNRFPEAFRPLYRSNAELLQYNFVTAAPGAKRGRRSRMPRRMDETPRSLRDVAMRRGLGNGAFAALRRIFL